ncbi:unnamed protein product, partial [Ectocarpus sp. 12 AP-2014]
GGGGGGGPGSWGLTEEAMEWLCRDGEHPAIVELQSRLCKLYPDFEISHMPEAVMGPSTARMVANAPVYGDRFSWHVDADPAAFPPSPWRDHFGTYTNRRPGMPLFATLLIYLDADWRREWDAETLFLDPPTGTGVFVRPRAGRAIVMDQDVTHRISTPSQTAHRPRYSLVLKLIFFSKQHGRYDNRSPSSPFPGITRTTSGTTPDSAAAPHGAPGVSHAPPEPCISSLSALRPKNDKSQRGGRVRFGSSSESSSERAHPSGRSSSPESTPPAAAPVPPPLFQGDPAAAAGGVEPLDAESPLVEVRPVGAKGKGLPIAKGVPVAFYSGEVLTAEQLDDRYPGFEGSDYVMQLGPDRYLDARDPKKSSIASRYANHSGRPNLVVELRPVEGNSAAAVAATASSGFPEGEGVALTTLRDVVGGEELTFDYGEE